MFPRTDLSKGGQGIIKEVEQVLQACLCLTEGVTQTGAPQGPGKVGVCGTGPLSTSGHSEDKVSHDSDVSISEVGALGPEPSSRRRRVVRVRLLPTTERRETTT